MNEVTLERIPYEAVGATWVIKVNGKVVATSLSEGWARLIAEKLGKR